MAVRGKRAKPTKEIVEELTHKEDRALETDGLPTAEYYRLLSPMDYVSTKERVVKHGRSGDIVNDLPLASVPSWIMDNLVEKVWVRNG